MAEKMQSVGTADESKTKDLVAFVPCGFKSHLPAGQSDNTEWGLKACIYAGFGAFRLRAHERSCTFSWKYRIMPDPARRHPVSRVFMT